MARFAVRTLCDGCRPSLHVSFEPWPEGAGHQTGRCDNGCPDQPVATFRAPWPEGAEYPRAMTLLEVRAMRAEARLPMAIFDGEVGA